MAEPTKSQTIVMVLDKDTAAAIGVLFHTAMEDRGHLARHMKEHGLEVPLSNFMSQLSKKEHALGWCDDPTCEEKVAPHSGSPIGITVPKATVQKLPPEVSKLTGAALILINACRETNATSLLVKIGEAGRNGK